MHLAVFLDRNAGKGQQFVRLFGSVPTVTQTSNSQSARVQQSLSLVNSVVGRLFVNFRTFIFKTLGDLFSFLIGCSSCPFFNVEIVTRQGGSFPLHLVGERRQCPQTSVFGLS